MYLSVRGLNTLSWSSHALRRRCSERISMKPYQFLETSIFWAEESRLNREEVPPETGSIECWLMTNLKFECTSDQLHNKKITKLCIWSFNSFVFGVQCTQIRWEPCVRCNNSEHVFACLSLWMRMCVSALLLLQNSIAPYAYVTCASNDSHIFFIIYIHNKISTARIGISDARAAHIIYMLHSISFFARAHTHLELLPPILRRSSIGDRRNVCACGCLTISSLWTFATAKIVACAF